MRPDQIPSFDDIRAAAHRIEGAVHRTPIFTSRSIDDRLGGEIFFKAENLQRAGAFKARGANNAVRLLTDEAAPRGVATHSSGNHGGALAMAARTRGIPCWVVMPEGAVASKVEAVRGYGAEVVFSPPTQQGREEVAAEVVGETGATFVHPFENGHVIAGQGTVALELLDQVADLDAIIVPVGGGGLAAGTALTTRHLGPRTEVFGAEPAGADDARRSLETGRIESLDRIETIADGLRATVGKMAFSILTDLEVPVVTASDTEIREAMQLIWERLKLVVEPSAAVSLAVLLNSAVPTAGRRIGVILSGGNVDFPG